VVCFCIDVDHCVAILASINIEDSTGSLAIPPQRSNRSVKEWRNQHLEASSQASAIDEEDEALQSDDVRLAMSWQGNRSQEMAMTNLHVHQGDLRRVCYKRVSARTSGILFSRSDFECQK